MKRFDGKVVVISGGSRGIGAAVALAFAQEGARLVLGYRNDSEAQAETYQRLAAVTDGVVWCKGDISMEEAVKSLFRRSIESFSDVDIVVINAGVYHFAPFGQIPHQQLMELIGVNQLGAYFMLREAGKIMKKKGKGVVVTVSSSAASRVPRMVALYAATKAFAETVTKGFALEYARYGIRANIVAPGTTDTEMSRIAIAAAAESINAGTLSMRIAQPAEIAKAVLFLCSEESSFINGQVLRVDGGSLTGL
jgi:3-oxoacyl-[acyl-carrier protein] reductase